MTSPNRDHLFVRPQLQTLVDGITATPPQNFSLIAAKFMGKTRILSQLADTTDSLWHEILNEPMHKITPMPFYFDCAWPEASHDLFAFLTAQTLRHLQQQPRDLRLDFESIQAERDSKNALRLAMNHLVNADYRPILLLDNFDTLITDATPEMEAKIDQLRPLTREVVLVVASERPLHEANRKLASSPLFNLLNQVFLRLVEPHETENYLRALTAGYNDQDRLVDQLEIWTGGHPFLLSRIGEILRDVDTLPTGQQIGADHLPLIRLRLSEDYGRLLFGHLWRALEAHEEHGADHGAGPGTTFADCAFPVCPDPPRRGTRLLLAAEYGHCAHCRGHVRTFFAALCRLSPGATSAGKSARPIPFPILIHERSSKPRPTSLHHRNATCSATFWITLIRSSLCINCWRRSGSGPMPRNAGYKRAFAVCATG